MWGGALFCKLCLRQSLRINVEHREYRHFSQIFAFYGSFAPSPNPDISGLVFFCRNFYLKSDFFRLWNYLQNLFSSHLCVYLSVFLFFCLLACLSLSLCVFLSFCAFFMNSEFLFPYYLFWIKESILMTVVFSSLAEFHLLEHNLFIYLFDTIHRPDFNWTEISLPNFGHILQGL